MLVPGGAVSTQCGPIATSSASWMSPSRIALGWMVASVSVDIGATSVALAHDRGMGPTIVIAMSLIESQFVASKIRFDLRIRDLGRMAYQPALALQREVQQSVIAARDFAERFMEILLVEHDPPVITVSRRPGARQHLLASEAQLKHAGVEVAETDRGGDITYHGPGQLVVYPILDLNVLNLRMVSYLRFLEQIVIDTLREFEIEGVPDQSATGVWVMPRDAR